MFTKTIPLAAAVVLSLSAGTVFADQTFHPSNDEPGTIMHVIAGTKSRAQVETRRIEVANNGVAGDGWRYVGGEAGWELVQHAYDFRAGKLVHTDSIDHSTPRPSIASIEQARKQYLDLYSGG